MGSPQFFTSGWGFLQGSVSSHSRYLHWPMLFGFLGSTPASYRHSYPNGHVVSAPHFLPTMGSVAAGGLFHPNNRLAPIRSCQARVRRLMMTSKRSVGGRAGKRNSARPRTSCRAAPRGRAPPSRPVSCGTGLTGVVRPSKVQACALPGLGDFEGERIRHQQGHPAVQRRILFQHAPRSSFSLSIGTKPPRRQIPPSGRGRRYAVGRTLTFYRQVAERGRVATGIAVIRVREPDWRRPHLEYMEDSSDGA